MSVAHHVSSQARGWSGSSGYVADPGGFRWEVAWNPGPIGLLVVPDTDVAEVTG